ncbi:hypothetical protein JX266_011314 [Neoarthrinium moseri]|nr:hypothetical protein JX266_011314 [Neoarthrinium moseri]
MATRNTFPNEVWLEIAKQAGGRGLTGIAATSMEMRTLLIRYWAKALRFQGCQRVVSLDILNFLERHGPGQSNGRLPNVVPRVSFAIQPAAAWPGRYPVLESDLSRGWRGAIEIDCMSAQISPQLPQQLAKMINPGVFIELESLNLNLWGLTWNQAASFEKAITAYQSLNIRFLRLEECYESRAVIDLCKPSVLQGLHLNKFTNWMRPPYALHNITRLHINASEFDLYALGIAEAFPQLEWLILSETNITKSARTRIECDLGHDRRIENLRNIKLLKRLSFPEDVVDCDFYILEIDDAEDFSLPAHLQWCEIVRQRYVKRLPGVEEISFLSHWPYFYQATRGNDGKWKLETHLGDQVEPGGHWPCGLLG